MPRQKKTGVISYRTKGQMKAKQNRLNETPEQREIRLAKCRAYSMQWRKEVTTTRSETPEQREARLERTKKNTALKMANETPKQRKARLERNRKNSALKIATETPEQREARLERNRKNMALKIATETPKQRKARLERNRKKTAHLRASETPEQREARLERNRKNMALKIATETPEQREARLERNRRYIALKRSAKKDLLCVVDWVETNLHTEADISKSLELHPMHLGPFGDNKMKKRKQEKSPKTSNMRKREAKQKRDTETLQERFKSESQEIPKNPKPAKKKRKRDPRANESLEARDRRLAYNRARKKLIRATETPAEREIRLEADRKRKALEREVARQESVSETPEQREIRLTEYKKRKEQLLAEMRELRFAVVSEHSCIPEPQEILELHFEEGQEHQLPLCESNSANFPESTADTPLQEYSPHTPERKFVNIEADNIMMRFVANKKCLDRTETPEQCELEDIKKQRAQLLAKKREMVMEIDLKLKAESQEVSQKPRPAKTKRKRDPRAYETLEARDKRLASDRARKALVRATETPEERKIRLETDRKLKALQREVARQKSVSETPEQRKIRLAEYKKRKEQLMAEMHELRLAAASEQLCIPEPQEILEVHFEEGQELQLPICESNSADFPESTADTPLPEDSDTPEQAADKLMMGFVAYKKCLDRTIIPNKLGRPRGDPRTHESPAAREKRLATDRARKAQMRVFETPEERAIRLERNRKCTARSRAKKILENDETHVGETSKANTPGSVDKYKKARRSGSNSTRRDVKVIPIKQLVRAGTSGVKSDTSKPSRLDPDTMDTEEITSDVPIKHEIDIEEERLVRVKTEVPDVLHQIPKSEFISHPIEQNSSIESSSIIIKLESDSEHGEDNYLVERNDISSDPTVIRDVGSEISPSNVNIKQESGVSIITSDYPNFDDAHSMDSSEAEALGKVETCLQDDISIKSENGVHLEDPHKEEFLNANVKMESDVISDLKSTEILPDKTIDPPKYSFVMKIPGDVMCNIDHMVSSCLADAETEDANFDTYLNNDTSNDNAEISLSKESLSYTPPENTLLKETDKTKIIDLHQFQLNSITGNILSLEQEAYNMMHKKRFQCPKCPSKFSWNVQLKKHLKVHQTIENYKNGFKKGVETKKRRALEKLTDSQEPCYTQEEIKTDIKEEYKCTCGKTFQRKTRMHTCLRSHDGCESEKYYCMTCLKDFKNKDELVLHRKRLHRKKFPCKFCPTDYATRKKLFKHLQIHQKVNQMEYKVIEEVVKGKKKLRCFWCSNFYEEISELKIHVMTAHEGPYSCPHCKNTFPNIIDFGNHTKTYHPEVGGENVLNVLEAFSRLTREWKCEECGLQFLEADKLALHQVEKHNPELKSEQQFQCPDCRRVFISQKGLTSHRRIHHSVQTSEPIKVEDTGILCLECRKMCKDMTALMSHMRFHSPDRKYPCKFCDFRFATPEKRKTHAEIHTGEMKYVCFICEYQCSSENRLKTHKHSLKHENMREYLLTGKPLIEASTSKDEKKVVKKRNSCKEDGKSDSSKCNEKEVTCDVCGERFPNESEMLEHKESHPFIEIPSADKPTRIFFK